MTHSPHGQRPPYAWLLPLMTLGLVLGVALARNAEAWQLPAAALASAMLSAVLLPGKRRIAALTLACAALGGLITIRANHPALPDEGEYVISGVVMDEVLLDGEDNLHLSVTLGSVTLDGEPLSGNALWTAYLDPDDPVPTWLTPGMRVTFSAEVYHFSAAANPGGYDSREVWLSSGVLLGVYGMHDLQPADGPVGFAGRMASLRHTLTMELMRVMGEEGGSLAAAMLLGPRDYISNENYAAFKRLGISHILSVSGYHVGVLALILTLLLSPLALPRQVRAAVLSLLLLLYAMLTGAAPPVIRAGLLLILFEVGKTLKQQNVRLHLLCLAAMLQLLMNPLQLFSASFQLTYSAMLGLFLIYPRLRRTFASRRAWLRWLWKGLCASLSVQLAILPAQLYWFGSLQLATLPANLLIIPLTSLMMPLYWLTLALLPIPVVREVFGALTGLLTRWLLALIRLLADLWGHSLWAPPATLLTLLGWALMMLGLSVLLRRRYTLLRRILALTGAALIALSLFRLPHTGVCYIQFSDGEADGALLHDENTVLLIDAGEYAYTIAGYLYSRRLPVDALILTHLHTDHAGGIEGLLALEIPVARCYLPEDAYLAGDVDPIVADLLTRLEESGTQIILLSRGDVITTPNGTLTVLWPQEGAVRPGQSANDTCLVLQADILGTTMLLTGDMTSRYEMYTAIPADILKVAHHGSAESTSPEFLAAVNPQVILLSCGTDEREAAFIPRAGDIPVYSTHSSGAITISFTENAFTVEPFLPR